jgi:hypothetical protein
VFYNDALELLTDSAGLISLGCGAFHDGHWVQYKWPTNWKHESFMRDITFLKLIPIVLAMFVWASMFVSKTIVLRIDNQALVVIVNKRLLNQSML